jgi:hypothetical protein
MPKRNDRRHRSRRNDNSAESRAAEVMTVGWMLTTFTTLVCELAGVTAEWFARRHPQALPLSLLAEVLMFAALLTGLFSLALLAAVWKLRTVKPPRGITVFAVAVGVAPLGLIILRQLLA